ncbi:helix-turn-helix transcriptional regulator [bacterium]|nr:helix-turn-helix transcriptional regulator [bacterium]
MSENKKLLGKRIKLIRKNAGYTQEKLSELIGIETGSLSSIESGHSFPSLTTLEKLSNALKVELKAFFDFEDTMSINDMRKIIINNINKIRDSEIPYIYKYFDGYK